VNNRTEVRYSVGNEEMAGNPRGSSLAGARTLIACVRYVISIPVVGDWLFCTYSTGLFINLWNGFRIKTVSFCRQRYKYHLDLRKGTFRRRFQQFG